MMRAKKPKRMGRPPKPNASRYTLRLSDDVVRFYRARGNSELTAGIELVARELMERDRK